MRVEGLGSGKVEWSGLGRGIQTFIVQLFYARVSVLVMRVLVSRY